MITRKELCTIPDKSDRNLLLLAQKEGCYYLACLWQGIDPSSGYTIPKEPGTDSLFSETDNPFVHLYRRLS